MSPSHRLLPPDKHLVVPTSSRGAARAGITLLTACKSRTLFLQRLAWVGISLFGPKAVPGERADIANLIASDDWQLLLDQWSDDVGDFDDMALHLRRPASRHGVSALMTRAGTPVGFVKVRPSNSHSLEIERRALQALNGNTTSFKTPAVVAHGELGDWSYLALTPLPPFIHTTERSADFLTISSEYATLLAESQEPRPHRSDWVPIHGDLTPWNLRQFRGGEIYLFDWENVTWGPPNADLLWYDAAVLIKGLDTELSGNSHSDEVAAYWLDRLGPKVEPGERSLTALIYQRLQTGWRPQSSQRHRTVGS